MIAGVDCRGDIAAGEGGFHVADGVGTVIDWNQGNLSRLDRDVPRTIGVFHYDMRDEATARAFEADIASAREISARLPTLRRVNRSCL